MFTWLGYKLGCLIDKDSENNRMYEYQPVLVNNWYLFTGIGFLLDIFAFVSVWVAIKAGIL